MARRTHYPHRPVPPNPPPAPPSAAGPALPTASPSSLRLCEVAAAVASSESTYGGSLPAIIVFLKIPPHSSSLCGGVARLRNFSDTNNNNCARTAALANDMAGIQQRTTQTMFCSGRFAIKVCKFSCNSNSPHSKCATARVVPQRTQGRRRPRGACWWPPRAEVVMSPRAITPACLCGRARWRWPPPGAVHRAQGSAAPCLELWAVPRPPGRFCVASARVRNLGGVSRGPGQRAAQAGCAHRWLASACCCCSLVRVLGWTWGQG